MENAQPSPYLLAAEAAAYLRLEERTINNMRWRGDKYGTQAWSLLVCETVDTGAFTQVPGVMPGANLLLHTHGKTKTKRALKCLDTLRQGQTALENVPKTLWQELHHRLLAGQKETQILTGLTETYPC